MLEEINENWKSVIKSLNEEVKLRKVVVSKLKNKDAYQRIKVKMKTRVRIGEEGGKTFTPPDKKVKREIQLDCDKKFHLRSKTFTPPDKKVRREKRMYCDQNFISKVKLSLPQIKR